MKKTLLKVGIGLIAVIATVAIALPSILHSAGVHPEYNGPKTELPGKRALIITTSHATLNAPGETTGDATFLDGGMQVDIASIKGGEIPIDPQTFSRPVISPEDKRYLNDAGAQAKAKNSIKIDDVDISQYDIVFISGGWGAAYDLILSDVLAEQVSNAYYGDKQR